MNGHNQWLPYLDRLRQLRAVRSVVAEKDCVEVETDSGRYRLSVQQKCGALNVAMEERILSTLHNQTSNKWILFAPYITPRLSELLSDQQVNFIDLAGNCHLELGQHFLIHIVKHIKPPKKPRIALRANGYRVLNALLAKPMLANMPVRVLATEAGISKSTAADALQTLLHIGLLHSTRSGRVLESPQLLDRWVAGYADQLRPSLFLARYQPVNRDIKALETRSEEALRQKNVRWAFSGGIGAERLTGHYHGDTVVIHLDRPVPELIRDLRLAPSQDGILTVLLAPGPITFDAAPRPGVAPASLVYAELLSSGSERAREAAERVREQYLESYS